MSNFINIIRQIGLHFYKTNCFSRAASLAYTTLLSLVPLFAVAFYVLTVIPPFKTLNIIIQNFILSNFVADSAQIVQQYFQQFVAQTWDLSIVSFSFLLISAVLLVFTMEKHFNAIWEVKQHRNGFWAFFLYIGIIAIVPLLIGTGIIATSTLTSLPFLSNILAQHNFILYLPYLATFIALAFLYLLLPNCKVPYSAAFIATLSATFLFELAKQGFTIYIIKLANYKIIYGALAVIPIFLIWLYISWVIILFGVVTSYVISNYKKEIKHRA